MRSLYAGGTGWLYRLSPRAKLAALALSSIGLFLTRDLVWLSAALCLAAIVLSQARLGLRETMLRLRPMALTIILVALASYLLIDPREATVTLLRLSALTLLGTAITASVSISQFIDEITKALGPLDRLGLVRAADIGLAVGLVIRFVPDVVSRYHALCDAHRARGLPVRLNRLLVPLIIMTLKDADAIADAIDARGFRGQTSQTSFGEPHENP